MEKRKNKLHYAWLVFASCILLKIGLGGVVMCISGNFVTPVVEELGCTVSKFTMLVSIEAAAMALLYTTAAKVLAVRKIGVVMGIAAIAQVAGIGLMSVYRSVYLFYLSGAIIGIGVAFTGYVAIPIVINMWFRKKAGTVLGIIIAAENIAMVLYSRLSALFIVNYGWRTAYLILALISLVVSVPPLFLFIKSPEDVGCKPYGSDDPAELEQVSSAKTEEVWGLTRKEALHTPVFYLIWLTCMFYSIGCGVQQYIANFATMELGQTISYGSNAAMCMSFGCVVSSVLLGYINDKLGVKAGLAWGALTIAAGYGLMIASISTSKLLIPAALFVGFGGSMYTVQCPLLARTVLGSKDYSSIWSLMMMGNSLIGAASFSNIGLFYDKGGSYRGAFIMAICLYCAALLLGSLTINAAKQLRSRKQI